MEIVKKEYTGFSQIEIKIRLQMKEWTYALEALESFIIV